MSETNGKKGLEEQILHRLDRLEKKMDTMQEALIKIAKTEERVVCLMEADNEKSKQLSRLQTRLEDLEKEDGKQTLIFRWLERFFWIVISTTGGYLAWRFRK